MSHIYEYTAVPSEGIFAVIVSGSLALITFDETDGPYGIESALDTVIATDAMDVAFS